MADLFDKHFVICNFAEGTSTAKRGAKAYVLLSGDDRLEVTYQSRGGRWITKWEAKRRLTNFRAQTIPPTHPLYERAWTSLDYFASSLLAPPGEVTARG